MTYMSYNKVTERGDENEINNSHMFICCTGILFL